VCIFFAGFDEKVPNITTYGINILSEVLDEEVFIAKWSVFKLSRILLHVQCCFPEGIFMEVYSFSPS
ncbi:MAG: hypothetical protein H8E54_10300, partial [Candidatus Aminicenantes bacterium]|nr:hypothetical protein [Candidatus Aminicenantes bacterium]